MDGDGHASREAEGTVIGANAVRAGIPHSIGIPRQHR